MRVAIVHYWLVGMRGGEKVVEDLCRIYPQADIFTHVYDPSSVSPLLRARTVKTSFIDRLPGARRRYQSYLPLMPMALEQLDLRNYDLIISSESGPAKGIIPPPHALHVCYCHSPMRYVWNMYHDYRERTGFLTKRLMPLAAHYVRNWDALSATRVDHFVANSQTVRQRIERYYRRDAEVIYPPVEVDSFEFAPDEVGDSFLMVGELVPYKRTELAVEAFNRLRLPLTVIGGGERLDAIRKLAGDDRDGARAAAVRRAETRICALPRAGVSRRRGFRDGPRRGDGERAPGHRVRSRRRDGDGGRRRHRRVV